MSAGHREAGFTLIEVLVSLAIFSLAIVGLNRAGALAVSGTSELQTRLHAGFVADNAVALARAEALEVGTERAQAGSGGFTFDVAVTTARTELQGFHEVTVAVSLEAAEQVIASRRAFRYEDPSPVNPAETGEFDG